MLSMSCMLVSSQSGREVDMLITGEFGRVDEDSSALWCWVVLVFPWFLLGLLPPEVGGEGSKGFSMGPHPGQKASLVISSSSLYFDVQCMATLDDGDYHEATGLEMQMTETAFYHATPPCRHNLTSWRVVYGHKQLRDDFIPQQKCLWASSSPSKGFHVLTIQFTAVLSFIVQWYIHLANGQDTVVPHLHQMPFPSGSTSMLSSIRSSILGTQ
jgi:hypothetical protein